MPRNNHARIIDKIVVRLNILDHRSGEGRTKEEKDKAREELLTMKADSRYELHIPLIERALRGYSDCEAHLFNNG